MNKPRKQEEKPGTPARRFSGAKVLRHQRSSSSAETDTHLTVSSCSRYCSYSGKVASSIPFRIPGFCPRVTSGSSAIATHASRRRANVSRRHANPSSSCCLFDVGRRDTGRTRRNTQHPRTDTRRDKENQHARPTRNEARRNNTTRHGQHGAVRRHWARRGGTTGHGETRRDETFNTQDKTRRRGRNGNGKDEVETPQSTQRTLGECDFETRALVSRGPSLLSPTFIQYMKQRSFKHRSFKQRSCKQRCDEQACEETSRKVR